MASHLLLSGLTIKTILELQKETTDRQAYPLWNNLDIGNASLQHANVPGLTTTQTLEGVAWDSAVVRDQMIYGKVKGLLKKLLPLGVRTSSLKFRAVNGGHRRLTFNFLPSNCKFINPYTFLGLMLRVKTTAATVLNQDARIHQPFLQAKVGADIDHIHFSWHVQFNERNPDFHMAKV